MEQGFSAQLTWSHYRALMRVSDEKARDFYEREAIEGGWDKRTLERQIHTQYYDRCLHCQQPAKIIAEGRIFHLMSKETLYRPPSFFWSSVLWHSWHINIRFSTLFKAWGYLLMVHGHESHSLKMNRCGPFQQCSQILG